MIRTAEELRLANRKAKAFKTHLLLDWGEFSGNMP